MGDINIVDIIDMNLNWNDTVHKCNDARNVIIITLLVGYMYVFIISMLLKKLLTYIHWRTYSNTEYL